MPKPFVSMELVTVVGLEHRVRHRALEVTCGGHHITPPTKGGTDNQRQHDGFGSIYNICLFNAVDFRVVLRFHSLSIPSQPGMGIVRETQLSI